MLPQRADIPEEKSREIGCLFTLFVKGKGVALQ
jgi:hypothetical protein